MHDISQTKTRRIEWLKEKAAGYNGSGQNPEGKLASKGGASRPLAIAARCWQCQGDDDAGTASRIKHCASEACALHPHRPYQEGSYRDNLAARKAQAPAAPQGVTLSPTERARFDPISRPLAVKAYCYDCMGGQPAGQRNPNGNVRRMVAECPAISCALWDVRPWQGAENPAEGDDNENDCETSESEQTVTLW